MCTRKDCAAAIVAELAIRIAAEGGSLRDQARHHRTELLRAFRALEVAIPQYDFPLIARAAHDLTGVFAQLGAVRPLALVRIVEVAALARESVALLASMRPLHDEVVGLDAELAHLVDGDHAVAA